MVRRLEAGEACLAEDILARNPELADDSEAALRLIYEEYCLRQERGENVAPEQFLERFPRWRPQLATLLDCHRLLLPTALSPDEVRRQVTCEGQFVIVGELGQGVNGPVFLATQPALANRAVVLKTIPTNGREHLTLARLQHTHIVPIYAALDTADGQRRILCMPYLGGTTLAQLLDAVKDTPAEDRTGQQLLTALDHFQPHLLPTFPSPHACVRSGRQAGLRLASPEPGHFPAPAREELAGRTWTEAVCWIGACLADALCHAHEHGLVHLDVKLSNILLTADAQPMLLDFHVAQKPIHPQGPFPEWLGGTPGYASPEQINALSALTLGGPIPQIVDGRSDTYSLGLVLYRLLGGTLPLSSPESVVPLNRINPRVSVGLADIVARCLEPDSAQRYPTAHALAEDLRRHLDDRPLLGVRNRSLRERWRKWRRRDPLFLSLLLVVLAVLALSLTFALFAWLETEKTQHRAEAALAAGERQNQARHYDKAREQLVRGLELCQSLPRSGQFQESLQRQLQLARRGQEVEKFHRLAEQLRLLCGSSEPSKGSSPTLEKHLREVWQRRQELLDRQQGELDPESEEQLRTDLLDLGIIWADLRLRGLARGDSSHAETLRLLQETEELFGESQVLCRLKRSCALACKRNEEAEQLGQRAEELKPRKGHEAYALGRWLLGEGDLDKAAQAFEQAVDMQPDGFWPNFYQGICAQRRGCSEEAVTAFRTCIALAPSNAPSYYNRALAQEALGQNERALRDYDRALEFDPKLAEAALNRGVLHLRAKDFDKATVDLKRALDRGASPDQVWYNLALIRLELQDRAGARDCVQRALQANPAHRQALELSRQLPP